MTPPLVRHSRTRFRNSAGRWDSTFCLFPIRPESPSSAWFGQAPKWPPFTPPLALSIPGLMMQKDELYQMASVPIDQGEENLGTLAVGERFDLSEFSIPAVLIRNGAILKSTIPGIPVAELETALKGCRGLTECDVRLRGASYISFPFQGISSIGGYTARSLQNVDSEGAPLQSMLDRIFLAALIGTVLVALLFSFGLGAKYRAPDRGRDLASAKQ